MAKTKGSKVATAPSDGKSDFLAKYTDGSTREIRSESLENALASLPRKGLICVNPAD